MAEEKVRARGHKGGQRPSQDVGGAGDGGIQGVGLDAAGQTWSGQDGPASCACLAHAGSWQTLGEAERPVGAP